MPTNPKGGCLICRKAKEATAKVIKNVQANTIVYAFFVIILIEFLSLRMQNIVSLELYSNVIYPLFSNIEMLIIFLYLYNNSQRLRFCKRQKRIIIFLSLYFLFNIVTLIFPICWGIYDNLINYAFLCLILITIIATWRNSLTK